MIMRLLYYLINEIGTTCTSANSVESDLGCTSRIYFDNVTLTLYNMTLPSQNHAKTITSVIAAKQMVINEVMFFSNKISL